MRRPPNVVASPRAKDAKNPASSTHVVVAGASLPNNFSAASLPHTRSMSAT